MRQQWSWMPDAQAVELSQSQFKTSQLTFFFFFANTDREYPSRWPDNPERGEQVGERQKSHHRKGA